jgi:hypothetical protein
MATLPPTTAAPLPLSAVIAQAQSRTNTSLAGYPTYLVNPQANVTATPDTRNESYLMEGQSAERAALTAELLKEAQRAPAQLKANLQPLQPLPTASQLQVWA